MKEAEREAVLIGKSGFLARWFGEELNRSGFQVTAIGSGDCDLTVAESYKILSGLVPKDAAIVVLSAITPDRGRDEETAMKNRRMGENIVRALEGVGAQSVLYVSTDMVYSDGYETIDEQTPCEPSTPYGAAHIFREQLFQEQGSKKGWPVSVLRPVAVYGPGDTHDSYGPNRFLRTAIADRKISLIGEGEEVRDHIYVKDLTKIALYLVKEQFDGVLNGASGSGVTFMEVARCVQSLVGADVKIVSSPRQIPIVHKRFDASKRRALIPDFTPHELRTGLTESFRALKK